MHLYRLGLLTLYSLTDIPFIRVPINESLPIIPIEIPIYYLIG